MLSCGFFFFVPASGVDLIPNAHIFSDTQINQRIPSSGKHSRAYTCLYLPVCLFVCERVKVSACVCVCVGDSTKSYVHLVLEFQFSNIQSRV